MCMMGEGCMPQYACRGHGTTCPLNFLHPYLYGYQGLNSGYQAYAISTVYYSETCSLEIKFVYCPL